jgi:hypothetical protein
MKFPIKLYLLIVPIVLIGAGCSQQTQTVTERLTPANPAPLVPPSQKPIIPPAAKNIPPPLYE